VARLRARGYGTPYLRQRVPHKKSPSRRRGFFSWSTLVASKRGSGISPSVTSELIQPEGRKPTVLTMCLLDIYRGIKGSA